MTDEQIDKIDINIVDGEVVVQIADHMTMDEAAQIFFDNLTEFFPEWLKDAGYIKEVKSDDNI